MARILVIEDEEVLRRIVSRALQSVGHEVMEAKNGKEALRLHRTTPSDLVITDLFMPEVDGIEVLMTLRKEAPSLKVIVMSGGAYFSKSAEPLKSAEALGAYAALHKPFALVLLLRTVSEALAA